MEVLYENMAQYGPLGLWTIYLIWNGNQMKQRFDKLTDNMLDIVKQNNELLETGLREMRNHYQETRLREELKREKD